MEQPLDQALTPVSEPIRKINMFLCSMAIMLITLDSTIANIALPHIQGTLFATHDQIGWVLTSYIVANAIFLPLTGFLSDRFGTRALLILSVALFTLTSALCGISQNLGELVLFRFLQGMAGAFIFPCCQTLMLNIHTRAGYAKAAALSGMGAVLGPIIGPSLGGYITEYASWRWVFLINVPMGIAIVATMIAVVPKTPASNTRRFDLAGFLLLSVAIACLQLLLDRGEGQGWFSSWEIIVEATAAGVLLLMFAVYTATSPAPFLHFSCFRDRNFSIGCLLLGVNSMAMITSMALLPGYLQNLLGMPVSTAGLLLMPRGVGSFFALFFINRAMDRLGIRTIISMGTFMAILSMELMRHFTLEISYTQIIASGLLQGLGISMVMLPSSILLFQSLDPLMRADGSVLSILARNLPASFGISIFFAYLSRNIQSFHAVLTEAVTPYEHWVNFPELWNWEETSGALLLNHEITRQASMQAYIADFALMEWLFLASIPLVFLLGSAPNHSPAGNAVPATH